MRVKRHRTCRGGAGRLQSEAVGDLTGRIGELIAPDVMQVPFALLTGLDPASDTGGGRAVIIAALIP
jgi:hypothetical protein